MAGNLSDEIFVIGAKFYPYSAFQEALEKYQKDTLTQFVKAQAEKIPPKDSLHERFQYVNVRLQCKQGKRYKKAEPTKDQRPCQRSFKVGCPVQLTLHLNRRPKDAPCLKITQLNLKHAGHEVSRQVFQLYPEQRRISVDEVDLTVLGSTTLKTPEQQKILEERHSVPIMQHSIYNLQQKI
ncbi:hypothetical protein PoB_005913400 [Plakobranchus ocellatus]|uniref:ZSWIM3 N-terminal domain-containing protein n=1 Tax=Plakobranchus ocellatus TaxID=259542 RepID=A0AAV4CIL6_9GAST|nr:hypothetical protein PoB_005913400 [Plakobranchus ocellatus]